MDILSGVGLFRTQTIPLTPNALNPHDEHREDRAELAWVNQPLDANKCSCRHMRCCEETNHAAGACTRSVETTLWGNFSPPVSAHRAGNSRFRQRWLRVRPFIQPRSGLKGSQSSASFPGGGFLFPWIKFTDHVGKRVDTVGAFPEVS